MFTDGVTEATDADYQEFGAERLDAILRQQGNGTSSQQMVEAIKTGIKDFVGDAEQSDDITMLVVRRSFAPN
jgi:sigma-B regulation protein RsbU (phosphoserine phosphatase)